MKKIIAFIGLFLICQTQAEFTDQNEIPEWAAYPIKKLVEKNIISGNTDGSFRPYDSINRAEFCKILVNTTGVKKYIPIEPSFSDVITDDWFFDYVETAKYHKWLEGYEDGTFRPGNKINRAEASKILVNAFGFEPLNTDKDENWYDKFVRVLRNEKLFPYNINDETFSPEIYPSRSEIVEQIFRFMKKTGKFSSYDLEDEETETTEEETTENTSTYTYTDNDTPSTTIPVSQTAGTLNVSKKAGGLKKIEVSSAQKEVKGLELYFEATKNPVEIAALQFRRIGNGLYSDFLNAWIEIDGEVLSSEIIIDNDLINIPLKENYKISKNEKKLITLKINLSGSGKEGNSSRFVLYLPEWISADTDKKIGFFPFGGVDLEIK